MSHNPVLKTPFILLDLIIQLAQISWWSIKHPFHGAAGLLFLYLIPPLPELTEWFGFVAGSFLYEHGVEAFLIRYLTEHWKQHSGFRRVWRIYAFLHFILGIILGLFLGFVCDVWLEQAQNGFSEHPILVYLLLPYFIMLYWAKSIFSQNIIPIYILFGLIGGFTALRELHRRYQNKQLH